MRLFETTVASPIGSICLRASDNALRALSFSSLPPLSRSGSCEVVDSFNPILASARRQLDAYFAGELKRFDLPLEMEGTEFEKKVWRSLLEIPYGETWYYGQLADHIGSPGAARAVGRANSVNPLAIVVPCHRVIGKSGALVGFGGGLPTKRFLLDLESGQNSLMSLRTSSKSDLAIA